MLLQIKLGILVLCTFILWLNFHAIPTSYINSGTDGELSILVSVLVEGEVNSDVVVQEVGQTLTGVAENLGVNITVISVQRLGEYHNIYFTTQIVALYTF